MTEWGQIVLPCRLAFFAGLFVMTGCSSLDNDGSYEPCSRVRALYVPSADGSVSAGHVVTYRENRDCPEKSSTDEPDSSPTEAGGR